MNFNPDIPVVKALKHKTILPMQTNLKNIIIS